jgi:predicted NUDIX family phosphoesterase
MEADMEKVLVFKDVEMQWLVDFNAGYTQDMVHLHVFREHMARHVFFMDREKAEVDPEHKQVIPYTLVMNEDTSKILAYKRTKKGGENRLHEKWSIGIGGHINPVDQRKNGQPVYMNAMERELQEEVGITAGDSEIIGLLYDPSNPVGQVHFGVVIAFMVRDLDIHSTEDAIGDDLQWVTPEEGLQLPNLENWSQLVLKGIINDKK